MIGLQKVSWKKETQMSLGEWLELDWKEWFIMNNVMEGEKSLLGN